MWHLLTHTAGLTYGFHYAHPLDGVYRDHGFEFGTPPGMDLAQARATRGRRCRCCSSPARSSTTASPPTSSATSVEVISGQTLDVFFKERILGPLGMLDTAFSAVDADRMAALYGPGLARNDRMGAGGAAAAGVPVGRRRAGLDRGRLPPLHDDARR